MLRGLEHLGVDDGFVGARQPGVAVLDLADEAAVAQDRRHSMRGPQPAAGRGDVVGVETVGDGPEAGLPAAVLGEDPPDDPDGVQVRTDATRCVDAGARTRPGWTAALRA